MLCLEAAFDAALIKHLRDVNWGCQSLEREATEVAIYEQAAHMLPRGWSDHDLAVLCQSLQTLRKDQRLTYSSSLCRFTRPKFGPDRDDAGGDPNTEPQRPFQTLR